MPEVDELPSSTRYMEAVEAVHIWMTNLPGSPRLLKSDELKAYSQRSAKTGWRLELDAGGKIWLIDILVDERFPRSQARIALVNGPTFLSLPHVEKDGVLCLLPDSAGINPAAPVQAVCNIMGRASSFLEEASAGLLDADFSEEFNSYWCWTCSEHAQRIVSLLKPMGRTRVVRIWRGKEFFLVAEGDDQIKKWLSNRFQSSKNEPRIDNALFVWMSKPLAPECFPKRTEDLLAILRDASAADEFDELTRSGQEKWIVVLGADTTNGPCLCGAIVYPPPPTAPPNQKPQSKLHRGFRSEKIPADLLKARFTRSAPMAPTLVERADGAWIHGRDCGALYKTIEKSSVVVFGCGSLGGPVASLLARAGVGRLVLVDPQLMAWANIGRHSLGAGEIGLFKARGLADRIRADFPHIQQVTALTISSEEALKSHSALIDSASLIVSAMGDWAAEGALNEWHMRMGRRVPVLYGWIEPFGVAGHCVIVTKCGGCLQCGLDEHGSPHFKVAFWKTSSVKQEPACGATFQPYGPIEAENVAALVAESALQTLLGHFTTSTHRIWAASQKVMIGVGGEVTPEWKALTDNGTGSRTEERQWSANPSCRECHSAPAS